MILNEVTSSSLTLTENNAEEFYYWIDRFLFREEKPQATLKYVEEAFGQQSYVFIQAYGDLRDCFRLMRDSGTVKVSFEQWEKFLSIAYGAFNPTEQNFLIHTYLSIFAKLLAYAVISNDDYVDDDEMRSILDGSAFHRFNIENFVENDFYYWVQDERCFQRLKKTLRTITQELSAFDFENVNEDILKGVYQELIDLDTRHALGEYYTPDWLCERVVEEFDFKPTDKILDPSCGSGSFLRAIIARFRKLHPQMPLLEICDNVFGIDVHPLSVQIAKTTLLLALGRETIKARRQIHLNVILANTLLTPQGVETLFGTQTWVQVDQQRCNISLSIFDDVTLFDTAMNVCEDLAEQTQKKAADSQKSFATILRQQTRQADISEEVIQSFYDIYKALKKVKEAGRDSIWKFIVSNLYKPHFLAKKFNYVIGNPPWFTYSSIRQGEYQDLLNQLAEDCAVRPERKANYPHLEIAAIFLAYCSRYFLQPKGKLAFVLPRSFFSADHHDNTRSGTAKGFRLTDIWDLNDVSPLFRIPSCVLMAQRHDGTNGFPKQGVLGKAFSGRLDAHNCNWSAANSKLTEEDVQWFYLKQGSSSAFSTRQSTAENQANPYKREFKQGATIVPRGFYFIELNQDLPPDFEDRVLNIRTASGLDTKKPWNGLDFKGRIESRFLFRTALSRSILPFALFDPSLIVLPVTIKTPKGDKKVVLHTANELRQAGFLHAAKWFKKAEETWDERKTERSKAMSSLARLNFQRGLVEQNLNAPYLVLYNSSAKDANATVVKRSDYNLEFFVESVTYVLETTQLAEAYYLTAILNSATPNEMMKEFQAKGLFGARHVHKKILDIYFPRFSPNNSTHQQLAALSEVAHNKASAFLRAHPPEQSLDAWRLGRLRLAIKEELESELNEIDQLVENIIF